jgi:hypothetical protein
MLKQWDIMTENLELIHGQIVATKQKDAGFKEDLIDIFLRVEMKIKETDKGMKILTSGVGQNSTASEKGSNSLWTTIKILQEDLNGLDIQINLMYERLTNQVEETARITTLDEKREQMKIRLSVIDKSNGDTDRQLETIKSNYQALCDHYEKSMKDVAEAIRKLNVGAR